MTVAQNNREVGIYHLFFFLMAASVAFCNYHTQLVILHSSVPPTPIFLHHQVL